jgi:hypothetical protein
LGEKLEGREGAVERAGGGIEANRRFQSTGDFIKRSRSSEMNCVLSPRTWGNVFQKRLMSGIFTFFGFRVAGRNSATGLPRRSLMDTFFTVKL